MLRTRLRVVPHIMRACLESLAGWKTTLSPSSLAATWSLRSRWRSPSLPLADSLRPLIWMVTPAGIATGDLPTRDMVRSSIDSTQDLAADIGGPGLVVGHDAARRRQDGDAQPVVDARQIRDLRVDAAARLRDAIDLADDGRAVVVLQLDLELGRRLAAVGRGKAADVALALQHLQHVRPQLRRRAGHVLHARPLSVADACQHIAEWVGHRHFPRPSFTSST